jgi:ATP-binding cassette subfamily F protein 2
MRTYTSFYNASLIAAAFGLSQQVIDQKISCLSDGQRTLLILAAMATQKPHLLLLDEATTNLDSAAVDCLAEGLKKWDGAVVIAGHDTRLISLVANEIWVCGKQKLTKEQTCNIMSYRDNVIKTAGMQNISSFVLMFQLVNLSMYRILTWGFGNNVELSSD